MIVPGGQRWVACGRVTRVTAALLVAALTLIALPNTAHAHAWAFFASTPVTPPINLIWVPIVFIAGSIALDWRIVRQHARLCPLLWRELTLFLILFLVVFMLPFFLDPGGPALPMKPYYGLAWTPWILWFLFWNAVVLVLFLLLKRRLASGLRLSLKPKGQLLKGSIAVYVACLLPYLAASSTLHGWAGGYVEGACYGKLRDLTWGLLHYAEAHEGRLPEADSTMDLVKAIQPYLEGTGSHSPPGFRDPPWCCPLEYARSQHPRPYEWNAALSGLTIDEVAQRKPSEAILRCPLNEFVHENPTLTVELFFKYKKRFEEEPSASGG